MTMIILSLTSTMVTAILSGLSTRLSQVIVAQTPHLADLLHLRPLHPDDLLISATGALGIESGKRCALSQRRPIRLLYRPDRRSLNQKPLAGA
jgi:hypothetical protein